MSETPWGVLQASLSKLSDRVDSYPGIREAMVSVASPLSVMFDTDTSPTNVLASLVKGLAPGDRVLTMKLSHYVWVLGVKGGNFDPSSLSTLPLAYENLIINGDFRVNQRVAASTASLASGAYFVDRWKSSSASNAVTWTGSDTSGRVLTVPSSKTIQQVIERTNIPAGTYTFAHDGTAQLRVYNVGGTVPSLATGPLTVTLDGTADVVVEFGAGTVSKVRGYVGTSAYPFVPRKIGDELNLSYRYYWELKATAINQRYAWGSQANSTIAQALIALPVAMRAVPTVSYTALGWTDHASFTSAVSAIALTYTLPAPNSSLSLLVTFASSGATYRPGALAAMNGTTARLAFDAEL